MKRHSKSILVASVTAALLALTVFPATAQMDPHQHEQGADKGGMMGDQGMSGMMGGREMRGMMRGEGMGCMMGGGGMTRSADGGMPHLPPGNDKLELQMHAEMMKAMSDILAKYAARLPDRK